MLWFNFILLFLTPASMFRKRIEFSKIISFSSFTFVALVYLVFTMNQIMEFSILNLGQSKMFMKLKHGTCTLQFQTIVSPLINFWSFCQTPPPSPHLALPPLINFPDVALQIFKRLLIPIVLFAKL